MYGVHQEKKEDLTSLETLEIAVFEVFGYGNFEIKILLHI